MTPSSHHIDTVTGEPPIEQVVSFACSIVVHNSHGDVGDMVYPPKRTTVKMTLCGIGIDRLPAKTSESI